MEIPSVAWHPGISSEIVYPDLRHISPQVFTSTLTKGLKSMLSNSPSFPSAWLRYNTTPPSKAPRYARKSIASQNYRRGFFLILTRGHFFIAFRERGREGEEREGKKHQCKREIFIGCLPYAPGLQSNQQPTTFWFTWQCSYQVSHPARARRVSFHSYSLGL